MPGWREEAQMQACKGLAGKQLPMEGRCRHAGMEKAFQKGRVL